MKLYLGLMLTWYRDILIAKVGLADSMLINIDRVDTILNEARNLNLDYVDGIIREIISTSSFLDRNANPKLAMGVLGLKIQEQ